MRVFVFALVIFAAAYCVAAPAQHAASENEAWATAELERQSKLPSSELTELLANCSSSQQSMYFCAWRDRLKAEHSLDLATKEKQKKLPNCSESIDSKLTALLHSRDQACAQSAEREWGGGSMESTGREICASKATAKLEHDIKRLRRCSGIPNIGGRKH